MKQSADNSRYSLSFKTSFAICFALALIIGMPGCSGCWKKVDDAAKKKKEEDLKKKKKKKEEKPFEIRPMVLQPADEVINRSIKPGHVATATQLIKSNKIDYLAELETSCGDKFREASDIENTQFRVRFVRPAALPKGQSKHFETLTLIPNEPDKGRGDYWLHSRVRGARGGRELTSGSNPTLAMPSYQYFLVVLSSTPAAFANLQTLTSISAPESAYGIEDRLNLYRVILPKIDGRVPVPSTALAWTSIAYVVWDGVLPDDLTPDQQEAILDWLNWGGQLIINGPESLDKLRGSFLHKYLPAESGGSKNFVQSDLDELNDNWSITTKKGQLLDIRVSEKRPLAGITLNRHEDGVFMAGAGELVVERQIGLGRIVATALPLTDSRIKNWGSYDSFFNACLLRKPAREFYTDGALESLNVRFQGLEDLKLRAPNLATAVRIFSRDVGDATNMSLPINRDLDDFGTAPDVATRSLPQTAPYPTTEDPHFRGYHPGHESYSNIADWDPQSVATNRARAVLNKAAGITLPSASTILKMLAVYLGVLVPLNWCVFRLLGRVEWAWIAAPIIAIVGAVVVVWYAQLDIGFASSRTELAILEIQGGYPRGHLTRYTSIYTSLSTSYDVHFEDKSALAIPTFEALPGQEISRVSTSATDVRVVRANDVRMQGFTVRSNSSGMFHSEQMLPLKGSLSVMGDSERGFEVKNGTNVDIKAAGLIYRDESGALFSTWLGDLAAETASGAKKGTRSTTAVPRFPEWEQYGALKVSSPEGEISVRPLLSLATESLKIAPGEFRLVGYSDVEFSGFKMVPAVSQATVRTMVVAHLKHPNLPAASPDLNSIRDFRLEQPTVDEVLESPEVDSATEATGD